MDLFTRPLETLAGFVPPYSEQETSLGYKFESVKIGGGFKCFDDSDSEPKFEDRHSISLDGETYVARGFISNYSPKFHAVADIVNEFLRTPGTERSFPKLHAFITKDVKALSVSTNYWDAVDYHKRAVDSTKAKIAKLQAELRITEIISAVKAAALKTGQFGLEDRQRFAVEFGLTFEEAKDYIR